MESKVGVPDTGGRYQIINGEEVLVQNPTQKHPKGNKARPVEVDKNDKPITVDLTKNRDKAGDK